LELKEHIQGAPCLLVFTNDGKLITKNGRGQVEKLGTAAVNKWNLK
jgi:hypothetical protein